MKRRLYAKLKTVLLMDFLEGDFYKPKLSVCNGCPFKGTENCCNDLTSIFCLNNVGGK